MRARAMAMTTTVKDWRGEAWAMWLHGYSVYYIALALGVAQSKVKEVIDGFRRAEARGPAGRG